MARKPPRSVGNPYLFIRCAEGSGWVFIPLGGSKSHEDSQEWPPYECRDRKHSLTISNRAGLAGAEL